MKFDKFHKVIIGSLTKQETRDFLIFLQEERVRHEKAMMQAHISSHQMPRIKEIWMSAVKRHEDDIDGIVKLSVKVREMFGL